MPKVTKTTRRYAAILYGQWRQAGVPDLVTAHEAYRLSSGRIGTDGDHATPVRLIDVALKAAR